MKWNELLKTIQEMSTEEQNEPVVFIDFGSESINKNISLYKTDELIGFDDEGFYYKSDLEDQFTEEEITEIIEDSIHVIKENTYILKID
jgi:hypothetical protein